MNGRITFDESAREDVLGYLDKEVDSEGMIIESADKTRVLTVDGEEISVDELGGIQKGSEVFIKNDLISVMRLSDERKG